MPKQLLASVLAPILMTVCWGQQPSGRSQPASSGKPLPDAPQLSIRERAMRSLVADAAPVNSSPTPGTLGALDASLISLASVRARLGLSSKVSSKMPSGSSFQASLEEPVTIDGQIILPRGTIFEGRLKTVRARRRMRRGSVFLAFERMTLPDGWAQPVRVGLVSADSQAVSADGEGKLQPKLSKKRLLIQVGGASLAAKFGDDLAELAAGTAVGAARARYFGLGASMTFLLLQRGPEVKLKPGDKLEVEFGRGGPLLPPSSAGSSPLLSNTGK